jgi:hypothetical protein
VAMALMILITSCRHKHLGAQSRFAVAVIQRGCDASKIGPCIHRTSPHPFLRQAPSRCFSCEAPLMDIVSLSTV